MERRIPQLDARLAAAAALVRPGLPVADIGCDHGKLTAHLAASGLYPRVIGADLRPGPLAKARATLANAGLLAFAELRLGDGLSVLSPGEVGTVVIAGVSAQTTIEMLEAAPWAAAPEGPRLVLVPATKHTVLRAWLYRRGFSLVRDIPVQAAGHWYAVMAAEYTGAPQGPVTLEQCLYGATAREPGGAAYGALQRGRLRRARPGMPPGDPMTAAADALLARYPEEQARAEE